MNKHFIFVLLILCVPFSRTMAQAIDLSSVDEFFKVTATLKEGKSVSEAQWAAFDSSRCYKRFASRENKTLINIIKSSINIAFGKDTQTEKERVLGITKEEMIEDKKLLLSKLILINYLQINDNYDSIKSFREQYDFNAYIKHAKQRLGSFLGKAIDDTIKFKQVNFFFISADGSHEDDAIYLDLNLVSKITEEQRIDFLAHEFFHNYREAFENHEFNYKCDLNYGLDMIQNEGIADLIDKTDGYEHYYTYVIELPEMAEAMVTLYNNAEADLGRIQNLILDYSNSRISKESMIDQWLEIVKFNGHPIGFYMARQIESAGYKSELLNTFNNPYQFFELYNRAAKKQKRFQLSDEFMAYFKSITKAYDHE